MRSLRASLPPTASRAPRSGGSRYAMRGDAQIRCEIDVRQVRKVGMGIFSVLKDGTDPWMQTGCFLLKGKELPEEITVQVRSCYKLNSISHSSG